MINPNIPWTNEFIRRKSKWQFGNAIRTGTRLNTDLELVYDLSINSDGSCSCTVGTNCDIADSYTLVETYAEVPVTYINYCFFKQFFAFHIISSSNLNSIFFYLEC